MSTSRSMGRKLLVAAGIVLGAAVLLVALLVVLVNSGVATKRAVELVLPSASRALGREVTVRDAKLKVFPSARVTLAGLTVAGRSGEPALVETEALDVEVGLWPLIRSLGKDIEVRAFTLVRPSLNLVKAKDGTWNFEGLGGATPDSGKPPAPAPSAAAPSGDGAHVAVALVKIEQAAIRVVDHGAGKGDAAVALTMLDLEARNVGPRLPFEARLAAALADTKQNLTAQLSVPRLPAAVPQRAEDWPEVQGSLALASLALDRVHALFPGDLGAIVRGGTASLDAKLTTARGAYQVDGTGELRDVRLRGQSSSGRFRAVASWSPAKPDAARLDVSDLALRGPGVDLGGTVSVETAPMRATFALAGPLLDVDAVMGILPEAEPGAKAPAPPPASEGELVPQAARREIREASARGTIAVEKLRAGRVEATDVKARATLSHGTLTLDDMTAAVFGGRVSAAGTKVALAEKIPSWKLAVTLRGLDLERATSAFAGRAPLLGKLDGTFAIDGKGTEWEKFRDALHGLAELAVTDGTLTTADLGGEVLGGVAKGLAALGRSDAAKRVAGAATGKTTFRDLAGKFTVKDGFLTAQSPLRFESSGADFSLGGRLGLDGRLEVQGAAVVPKKLLAEVVSGVPLPEKLEVPFALGGTLASPSVSVRADQVAATLVKGEAKAATKEVREKAEERGKKAVEGLLDRFKRK
jgi:AsmA protein